MMKNELEKNDNISKIYKGISYNERTGRWSVYVNNKCVGLAFKTEEEAYNAAKSFFEESMGVSLDKLNAIKKRNDTQSYMKEYVINHPDSSSKKLTPRINYSSHLKKEKEKID